MTPPLGTLVHSLGHNSLGKADIAIQTVFLTVAFIAVALRLWSRRLQWLSLQINDCLIICATFLMVGRYVVEFLLILLCGMGLRSPEVTRVGGNEVVILFGALMYAGDLIWITVMCLTQLSILDYYVRSFGQRAITLLSYVTMALSLALWIAGFFATAFLCNPPSRLWNPDTSSAGRCGDLVMLHNGINAAEVILSFFILALPVPITWRMILSRPRKFGLVGTQALGLIVIAIIGARMRPGYDNESENTIHDSAKKSIMSCLAPLLGIITACLPILPPAIQRIVGVSTLSPPSQNFSPSPHFSRYWNTTVLSGMRIDEPEMPLVTVHPPFMAKAGYLAPGHIQITSDWEIHSSRGSARLDRSPVRRS